MNQERLMKIILAPCISEKNTVGAEKQRQFAFRVMFDADKTEIRQAIELLFQVEVEAVRVCNVKGKAKVFKQRRGKRQDWKKAYVSLKKGFDINFSQVG